MRAVMTKLCNIISLLFLFVFVFDNSKDATQSNSQIVWNLYKAPKHAYVLEKGIPEDVNFMISITYSREPF